MATSTQTISGVVATPGGSAVTSGYVQFKLSSPDGDIAGNENLPKMEESVAIGNDGSFTVNLWPNTRGYKGTVYSVYIQRGTSVGTVNEKQGIIQVGETGPYNLSDLLSQQIPDVTTTFYKIMTQGQYNAVISSATTATNAADSATNAASIAIGAADDAERARNDAIDATSTKADKATPIFNASSDPTKRAQFVLGGISTGTLRTYNLPNANGSLMTDSQISTAINAAFSTVENIPTDGNSFTPSLTCSTPGNFPSSITYILQEGRYELVNKWVEWEAYMNISQILSHTGSGGIIIDLDQIPYTPSGRGGVAELTIKHKRLKPPVFNSQEPMSIIGLVKDQEKKARLYVRYKDETDRELGVGYIDTFASAPGEFFYLQVSGRFRI